MNYLKNTEQNTSKTPNEMPQKCRIVWWIHLYFLSLRRKSYNMNEYGVL